jgi:hypothetical protein
LTLLRARLTAFYDGDYALSAEFNSINAYRVAHAARAVSFMLKPPVKICPAICAASWRW